MHDYRQVGDVQIGVADQAVSVGVFFVDRMGEDRRQSKTMPARFRSRC